jgi:glycerol-3-phosphate dehydrogenase (NAD(P)+)
VSRVAIVGAGSWGTALAVHLAGAGHDVALWGHRPDELALIAAERENRKFLAGIALPDGVKVRAELEAALEGSEFVLFVVPSQAMREAAARVAPAAPRDAVIVSASKGLELRSLERMSEVLGETFAEDRVAVLTGPSHAEEVGRGVPTSIVAAAASEALAERVQALCSTPRLRVYTNLDVTGCEMGAALKNVIAIAAGVCDGLGFGDNTQGALLTRGLAEIGRLGVAMGGRRETFFGLAGLGDLIATARSRHSRNRHVGECLGRGQTIDRVLSEMVMVAEGVHAAKAARELGRRHGVELPITEQVHAMLFEGTSPPAAMNALMTRDLRRET